MEPSEDARRGSARGSVRGSVRGPWVGSWLAAFAPTLFVVPLFGFLIYTALFGGTPSVETVPLGDQSWLGRSLPYIIVAIFVAVPALTFRNGLRTYKMLRDEDRQKGAG